MFLDCCRVVAKYQIGITVFKTDNRKDVKNIRTGLKKKRFN